MHRDEALVQDPIFMQLIEHSTDYFSILNQNQKFMYFSPSNRNLFTKFPNTLAKALKFVYPEHRQTVMTAFSNMYTNNTPETIEFQFLDIHGNWRWLQLKGTPIVNDNHAVTHVITITRDITERIQMNTELLRINEHYHEILDGVPSAFFSLDEHWRFTYMNSMSEVLLKRKREELLQRNVWDEFPEAVGSTFYKKYHTAVKERNRVSFDEFYPPLNTWFEVQAFPISNGLAVYYHNISKRKIIESQLLELNDHFKTLSLIDELTGLANRRHLQEYASKEWQLSIENRSPLAVIFIDIDFFKNYNDFYGHQKGDQCLQEITQQIVLHFTKSKQKLIARYGGEEFVIILPNAGQEEAFEIAQSICRGVASMKIEHPASPVHHYITISAGVAAAIPEPEQKLEYVIELADKALYAAKKMGRNRAVLYEANMTDGTSTS